MWIFIRKDFNRKSSLNEGSFADFALASTSIMTSTVNVLNTQFTSGKYFSV